MSDRQFFKDLDILEKIYALPHNSIHGSYLIKHYSDIFFSTLILGCLIALTLFVINRVCRAKSSNKESSNKLTTKTHIERLEKYVLGMERSDFKEDLINTQNTCRKNGKISSTLKPVSSSDTSIDTSSTAQGNHIVVD